MVVYAPGRTSQYPEIPPDRGLRYHYLGGEMKLGTLELFLKILLKSLAIGLWNSTN